MRILVFRNKMMRIGHECRFGRRWGTGKVENRGACIRVVHAGPVLFLLFNRRAWANRKASLA